MLSLILISSLAGFLVKYLDIDKRINLYTITISLIASILLSYLTYVFPDIAFPIALSVFLLGKTKNLTQFLNFLFPLITFIFFVDSYNQFYFLIVFFLSILDEIIDSHIQKRPALPLGLLLLFFLTSSSYLLLAFISIFFFDLSYSLSSYIFSQNNHK